MDAGGAAPILAGAGAALILPGGTVLDAVPVSGEPSPGKTTNAHKPRLLFSLPI